MLPGISLAPGKRSSRLLACRLVMCVAPLDRIYFHGVSLLCAGYGNVNIPVTIGLQRTRLHRLAGFLVASLVEVIDLIFGHLHREVGRRRRWSTLFVSLRGRTVRTAGCRAAGCL